MGDNRFPEFTFNPDNPAVSILENCLENERTECYVWQGHTQNFGYGVYYVNGVTYMPHKVLWTILNGPVPDGYKLRRKPVCEGNKLCCNPDHMELWPIEKEIGGKKEYRHRSRNSKYMTKLSEEDVLEIRRRYREKELSQTGLAKEYGVTQMAIWEIVNKKTWAHI